MNKPPNAATIRMLGWLLLATLLVGGCGNKISDRDIQIITLAEARRLAESDKPGLVLFVDPRSEAEFAAGHIPGASNIALTQVSAEKGGYPPELSGHRNLVVYGDDPGSAVARGMAKRLMHAGHKHVRLFSGGLREWRGAGLKTSTLDLGSEPAPGPG